MSRLDIWWVQGWYRISALKKQLVPAHMPPPEQSIVPTLTSSVLVKINLLFNDSDVKNPGAFQILKKNQTERRDWADVCRQTAAARRGALEERHGGRAGTSGGINTPSHSGFWSDPEPFTGGRRARSLFFLNFWDLKGGFRWMFGSTHCLSRQPLNAGAGVCCWEVAHTCSSEANQ